MQDKSVLIVASPIGAFELTYSHTIAEKSYVAGEAWGSDEKRLTGKGIPVLSVDIKETVTINRVDYDQIYLNLVASGSPGDYTLSIPAARLYNDDLTTYPRIKRSDTDTCYESKVSDSAEAKIQAAIGAMLTAINDVPDTYLSDLISAGLKKECDEIKSKAAKVEELFLSLAQIAEQVPQNYRSPDDMNDGRADFIVTHKDVLRDMTERDVTYKAVRAARKLPDAPPALMATLHDLEGLN
jgi:hypothetical protein